MLGSSVAQQLLSSSPVAAALPTLLDLSTIPYNDDEDDEDSEGDHGEQYGGEGEEEGHAVVGERGHGEGGGKRRRVMTEVQRRCVELTLEVVSILAGDSQQQHQQRQVHRERGQS